MATDVVSRVTTVIAVVDKSSAAVTAIQRRFQALGQTASSVAGRFRALADRTGLSRLPGVLHSIHERALEVGKGFVEMMLPLLGLGAGGATAAALFDLGEGLHRFVEEGSRLSVVSERIGVTVGNLQDLEYAASLFKVPADVLDTNLQRLNRTLALVAAGKNKEATKLLGFVGIAARDAHGHVRAAADVFPQLADAMARIHNPAQRARLAVGLFGKGGQALIPVLAQGSRALAAARADMDKLGRMTASETHEAHALEIAQLRLHRAFDRVQEIIGGALAPYTKKAVDYVRQWIVDNRRLIETKIHEYVKKGADAIATFSANLKAIDWGGWLESLQQTGRRLLDIVDRFGGVNRVLKFFGGLLVAAEVAAFANKLLLIPKALKLITLALYANPYLAAGALLIAFALLVYKYWNQITHWVRYYSKVVVKEATYYFHQMEEVIGRTLGTTAANVQRQVDLIVGYFNAGWRQLADNPFIRVLAAYFGIGLSGAVSNLTTPVGGGSGGGAGRPYPEPPATGAFGPYRKGYQYPPPPSGSVDVNVHLHGAPPGTRANAATKGRGLRTSMNVGYSMAHLTDVG